MDKIFLLIELYFIFSVLFCLFIPGFLFLKILLVILLSLFIYFKRKNYIYNKNKFLFVSYGLSLILVFFIILNYINNIIYIIFVSSFIIIFFYLSKFLFNTTYGLVISKSIDKINVEIKDVFFNKKVYSIKCDEDIKINSLVLLKLSPFLFFKKPTKVLKVISNKGIGNGHNSI